MCVSTRLNKSPSHRRKAAELAELLHSTWVSNLEAEEAMHAQITRPCPPPPLPLPAGLPNFLDPSAAALAWAEMAERYNNAVDMGVKWHELARSLSRYIASQGATTITLQ